MSEIADTINRNFKKVLLTVDEPGLPLLCGHQRDGIVRRGLIGIPITLFLLVFAIKDTCFICLLVFAY